MASFVPKPISLLLLVLGLYAGLSGCDLVNRARCPDVTFSYQGDQGDVFYPNASQPARQVLPTLDPAVLGVFSIEQQDLKNGDQADLSGNIPDFNTNTGGFNLNNPGLMPGVRYTIRLQPSEQCYRRRSYTASFLVQGLQYKSGVYALNTTATLAPTYNGDGRTPLPANIVPGYSFIVQDARQNILQRGERGTPDAAVVNRDVQLDLRRLRQFFAAQPAPTQPLRLAIDYTFIDGNYTVVVRQQPVEVYYFRNRSAIPTELLARVTALNRFPAGRTEDVYAPRPPAIIIVDALD